MNILTNDNTLNLYNKTEDFLDLYNYLQILREDNFFAIKTADIISIQSNTVHKIIDFVYFTINKNTDNPNLIQIIVFIYPKYSLKNGYKSINSYIKSFINDTLIEENKIYVDFETAYIKIKSDYIDISLGCKIESRLSEAFIDFKNTLSEFFNIIEGLLHFIDLEYKGFIKINKAKVIQTEDYKDGCKQSIISIGKCPKALDRVLARSTSTIAFYSKKNTRGNTKNKEINNHTHINAWDKCIKKDKNIPEALKRFIDNERH